MQYYVPTIAFVVENDVSAVVSTSVTDVSAIGVEELFASVFKEVERPLRPIDKVALCFQIVLHKKMLQVIKPISQITKHNVLSFT